MTVKVVETSQAFLEELTKMGKEVSFLVAYGKGSAEPILIGPGATCVFGGKGVGPLPVEMVIELLKDKDFLEVKATTVCRAYRNPECQQIQTTSGEWVCVKV
jgi:hypothetical protein